MATSGQSITSCAPQQPAAGVQVYGLWLQSSHDDVEQVSRTRTVPNAEIWFGGWMNSVSSVQLSRLLQTWAINLKNSVALILSRGKRVDHEGKYSDGVWRNWSRGHQ